jgi:hypothetical protein
MLPVPTTRLFSV